MYINAASSISAQLSFRQPSLLRELKSLQGTRLRCEEPDYNQLIEPKLIRRMSRIIRMSVATAMDALQVARINDPSAIITGTAYGCLEDTGIFLRRIVDNNEEMLTPTAFIQSTHNTVGAQIALLLKCHSYNNTYVQRAHSFESALIDTILFLKENKDANVLMGAADELTDDSFEILQRFNLFSDIPAGEGASFFVAGSTKTDNSLAELKGLKTLLNPSAETINETLQALLEENGLRLNDLDLVLSGRPDEFFRQFSLSAPVIQFKHLCGEYPTATAFALWLACHLLQEKKISDSFSAKFPVLSVKSPAGLKNLLICNTDYSGYHSFMLLSAC
jgi:3-oxoacyl-[acyl-carrier-protein] synthase II